MSPKNKVRKMRTSPVSKKAGKARKAIDDSDFDSDGSMDCDEEVGKEDVAPTRALRQRQPSKKTYVIDGSDDGDDDLAQLEEDSDADEDFDGDGSDDDFDME
jgi:hypothetical protein